MKDMLSATSDTKIKLCLHSWGGERAYFSLLEILWTGGGVIKHNIIKHHEGEWYGVGINCMTHFGIC